VRLRAEYDGARRRRRDGGRPCARLLLALRDFQKDGGPNVVAVHDRTASAEEIEDFRKDNGIAFSIVRVPEADADGWQAETWLAYGVRDVPAAALIDAQGNVMALGDPDEVLEKAKALLPKTL